MAKKLNLHEVKTQFSMFIEMVEAGETVIVCKRNVPVAEIRPISKKDKTMRVPSLGLPAGMSGSFAALDLKEMPKEELVYWEGGDPNDPLQKYLPKPGKRRQ